MTTTKGSNKRKRGAQQGNQNAVKEEAEKVDERTPLTLSLNTRYRERLRNAIAWHEGYIPEDEKVEKKARQIAYAAWEVYCDQIEKEQERAIIC